MRPTFRVQEKGLRELGARLRKLNGPVKFRVCGRATAKAAQIVKAAVKSKVYTNPSYETGSLYRSVIAKKLRRGQTRLTSEHIVTFKGKAGKARKDGKRDIAPHAHFIEFGTVKMPAEPVLRPGFESSKERAKNVMIQTLRDGIAKAEK